MGPDKAIWFTETNEGKIGRMDLQGRLTNEYPLPTEKSVPAVIVTGPDGALWFTENTGADKIGRITTRGVITEFTGLTKSSGSGGIVVGPDKALWFTEYLASKIGRLVPPPRPSSSLQSMSPDNTLAGSNTVKLLLRGSGFAAGAGLYWYGQRGHYTPLSAQPGASDPRHSISATVPAALVASATTAQIVVANPGELASNSMTFTVKPTR